jgi:hypothetical protein
MISFLFKMYWTVRKLKKKHERVIVTVSVNRTEGLKKMVPRAVYRLKDKR